MKHLMSKFELPDHLIPHFTGPQKRMISGVLVLSVLTVGTILATAAVKRSQEIRQRAAVSNGVAYSLTSANRILVPGKDSAVINVIAATNQQQMTATDLKMTVDGTKFDFVALRPGTFFNQTNTKYPPNNLTGTVLWPVNGTGGTFDAATNTARMAYGIPCDKCVIGPTPTGTTIPTCEPTGTNTYDAKCYAKAAGTSGTVAQLEVKAKFNQVGKFNIGVASTTQTSGLGSDLDVTHSSGYGTLSFCLAYDFDKNSSTNAFDIQAVANRWGSSTGQANYDSYYDLDNNGTINAFDIQYVANNWGTSCTP
jgi:hypothetical protein